MTTYKQVTNKGLIDSCFHWFYKAFLDLFPYYSNEPRSILLKFEKEEMRKSVESELDLTSQSFKTSFANKSCR